MKTLLFYLALVSCSTIQSDYNKTFNPAIKDKPTKVVIAEELIPFYDLFMEITKRDPYEVSAYFEDIEQVDEDHKVAAYCMSGPTYNYIIVDPAFWKAANKYGKETTILHELGHCVLDRDHIEETMPNPYFPKTEIPVSIMYPMNIGNNHYYEMNRKYYHKELILNAN